jgi:hypothetical protein
LGVVTPKGQNQSLFIFYFFCQGMALAKMRVTGNPLVFLFFQFFLIFLIFLNSATCQPLMLTRGEPLVFGRKT